MCRSISPVLILLVLSSVTAPLRAQTVRGPVVDSITRVPVAAAFLNSELSMRRVILALTAAIVPVTNIAAQQEGSPEDPRVRVTYGCATGCERVIGTVVAFTSDSMVIRIEGQPGTRRLALASVSRYELDRGAQESRTGTLAGVGVMVGIIGGGLVGVLVDSPTTSGCGGLGTCDAGGVLIGAGIGLALGVTAGYLIGRSMTPDRWVEIDLGFAQVGMGPRRARRYGLGASIPF